MGLPIAIGGKALSSRAVCPPQPIPEDGSDGSVLEPCLVDCPPRLATAVSHDHTLSATCSISYYEMMKIGKKKDAAPKRECFMAEIRLQISPLSQAYSTTYRDTLHRVPFPNQKEHDENEVSSEFVPLSSSVVFASDGRNLAVLVPHPRLIQSILVIFQLRKPRTTPAVNLPRPSYLGTAPTLPLIRVATNPQITKLPDEAPLRKASAITNIHTQSGGSLLLAGCVDGSILVIAYRPSQVAGILHSGGGDALVNLAHVTNTAVEHNSEDGSRGKLVAIQQGGMAILFSSHLVISESTDMMLMQLHKRCEMCDSKYKRGVWMGPSFLALLTMPSLTTPTAAQVWPISENDDHPSEPVTTLVMNTERLEENAHGTFALEGVSQNETTSLELESVDTCTCLEYDESSGCLAISSFVLASFGLAVPFCCIWHWRTNVVGLTLKARLQQIFVERGGRQVWRVPIYSYLYFARDFEGSKLLAHVLSDSAREWKSQHQNRIRKEVYALALLSPSETLKLSGCQEPSSLMVSSKCVTFPVVSNPFAGEDCEFVWKNARIPSSYTATFGAPRLACIGRKQCRSIAVAGTKGMCVLDCSRLSCRSSSKFLIQSQLSDKGSKPESISKNDGTRTARIEMPKWRLFGNETDERTFRVLSMTWWEGSSDRKSGLNDDLLVAVIAVQDENKDKKEDNLHLACWSPRRLDQANQMMVRWRNGSKSRSSSTWGIRLPAGFIPSSISLLADTPYATDTNSGDNDTRYRRAMLLLYNNDNSKEDNENTSYQLYQLEMESDGTYDDSQETRFIVKAKKCSDGNLLETDFSSEAPVSGVFLASASFDFDNVKSDSTRYLHDDSNGSSEATFHAVVGVIRSPCEGLEAVLITSNGVYDRREIISGARSSFGARPSSEVSSYWHSHTIPFDPSKANEKKRVESFFVWSIELCDGTMICWSVPYVAGSRANKDAARSIDKTSHASNLTNDPFTNVDDNGQNMLHQSLFGSVTSIGNSSSWIQEISVANRTGFTLGCIPSTPFGCMLRCSQSGKDLHRFAPVEDGDHGSAKDLDHEVFCLGNTELAPPSLVPSLYTSLVGRVEKVGSDPFDSHVSYTMDFSSNTVNAFNMLKAIDHDDTALLALRTLIVRILESIAKETDKMGNDISAQHSLFMLTTTFADIVDAAKERLPPMQFVSLFLSIGRQIEPSYLVHLFPLPLSTSLTGNEQQKVRSVEDLFLYSVNHGSISVASSALPLFTSKRYSLKMCGMLLRHCLETFEENTQDRLAVAFDLSGEERRMIRSVFNFGVRIEDSGTLPPVQELDEDDPLRILQSMDESVDATNHSMDSSASVDSPLDGLSPLRGHLAAGRRSSAKICQMFSGSSFLSQFQRPKEEEQIFDAASSFILSGFDEVKVGFESERSTRSTGSRRPPGDGSVSSASESGEITMAGIVASFLLPLAFPTEQPKQTFRWKRTNTFAHVLLGHSTNKISSSKIHKMTKLADTWSLEEIIFSLQISNSSLNNDFSTAEKEKWLIRLLKRHLTECGMMMSTAQATTVLRLVMVLLDRYSYGRDIKARSPGLLLLGIIVAHCAGFQRELLDARPRNKFTSSYGAALSEMRHR